MDTGAAITARRAVRYEGAVCSTIDVKHPHLPKAHVLKEFRNGLYTHDVDLVQNLYILCTNGLFFISISSHECQQYQCPPTVAFVGRSRSLLIGSFLH